MERIKQAQFLTSAIKEEQWPQDEIPEFCFVGRSNVGKSTFLNTICNNGKLARVSQTPGKTQMLNFFTINNNICRFVDVPGYGFAKVSNEKKIQFATMMDEYFQSRKNLKAVFLLLDLRHAPSKDDIDMLEYLQHYHLKIHLIATKVDKVKNSQLVKNKKLILLTLKLSTNTPIILFSSISKQGIDLVISKLADDVNTDEFEVET
ncbi:ribosome biogenesis GTP-binding protein YihA/YsxC [Spiroplasma endosymbiont of Lariophagus distinguendus]|uniref:ribosome biogenesis GTP-binding protein YihA/YsxC n=1 Tax=Spiroplasma endosymbiont of Lariophagus distinguendus TaxID=2935082 RepID=UPI00207A6591|nr:ribosome biogenesis GTP-binding protein YihA/YsxC [Spiroplasma endosymbiont of Lariophagus distinguendus]